MQTHYEKLFPATLGASAFLILLGLVLDTPSDIMIGLYRIVTMQDLLITDYVHIAGVGATLINSGLVMAVSILLIKISDDTFNGFTLVEMLVVIAIIAVLVAIIVLIVFSVILGTILTIHSKDLRNILLGLTL